MNYNKIQLMPKDLFEKIAAGEVVTSPLSVVKELVENSIDAEASKIIVELKSGGIDYIRVTDDGHGVPYDDMKLAFMPHASSKIKTNEDLTNINTLGFRGEALGAIAAVSKVEFLSKIKGSDIGGKVKIHGGEILSHEQIGTSDGSSFIVRDLFYNTPARLKFLKSEKIEGRSINDFISKIALAYPNISFRLINNDRILFSTNAKGDILKNIITVYGKGLSSDLLYLEDEEPRMQIKAYVSKPDNSRSSKKYQIIFVNGRIIGSKVIEDAISEAYKELLFEKRYPLVYLFLNINPSELDVNIHPAKMQVRFDDDKRVADFVSSAIREKLMTKSAVPDFDYGKDSFFQAEKKIDYPIDSEGKFSIENLSSSDKNLKLHEEIEKDEIIKYEPKKAEQVDIKTLLSKKAIEEELNDTLNKDTSKKRIDIASLNILGIAFANYIIAQEDETLYFVDQHAAHERIYYEKFMEQFNSEKKHSQLLLVAEIIDIPQALRSDAREILDILRKFAYQADDFGNNTYLIKAVPAFLSYQEALDYLNYILDNIDLKRDLNNPSTVDDIIMKSCKSAVKANDKLHIKEVKSMFRQLEACNNPYSCPHGRPVFVKIFKDDIERLFKRK